MSEKGIKGYKVFNPDWTCNPDGVPFQYEVGKTYEENVKPRICERGFHFCQMAADCFNFYTFDPKNKVAEVLALGEVVSNGEKSCTNKIRIVREIPWAELLEIVNVGKNCTGLLNTGNYNTGDYNTGHYNTGARNTGDGNAGNWNTGHYNTGIWNTGDGNAGDNNTGSYNTGDYNAGNHNKGNYNIGSWNNCSFSNGFFNTKNPKIYMFNKPTSWTYQDWFSSDARSLLDGMPKSKFEYCDFEDMTDEEKAEYPEAEITGGYLKEIDNSECRVAWWKELSNKQKNIIMSLPNFDKEIFKEITEIDVDEK